MTSIHSSGAVISGQADTTAKALQKLYYARAAFSITWVILVFAFARTNASIATVLFIVYPAWDAIATYLDIRTTTSDASKGPQYGNIAISFATTIAVVLALQNGISEVLIVFGIWAIITGLIQLIVGVRRRKQLGGQWPMIISGAQSMVGGTSFIISAHAPAMGIASVAGYAAFGAFYFLLAAIRLSKTK